MIAVGFAAFDEHSGLNESHGGYIHYTYLSGWPLVCWERYAPKPMFSIYPEIPEQRKRDTVAVLLNLTAFMVIVASSVFVAHRLPSPLESRQFYLAHLFLLMNAVAVLATILHYELRPMTRIVALMCGGFRSYYPITLYPWWIFVPVLYGLACFVIVVSFIIGVSTYWTMRRLKHFLGSVTPTTATR